MRYRPSIAWQACALLGAVLSLGLLSAGPARAIPNPLVSELLRRADPRIVPFASPLDRNQNCISDLLEEQLTTGMAVSMAPPTGAEGTAAAPLLDLLVALDHPPTTGDVAAIEALGGQVLEGWDQLVYALRVALPASSLSPLASSIGVVLVEENAPTFASLYLSTRQTRARAAWVAPASEQGDATHNVAVLDSGIDINHPDLAGKVPAGGWVDEIGQNASSPAPNHYASAVDIAGHGSAVAGIIAGLGTQEGLGGTTPLSITQPMPLYVNTFSPLPKAYFPINTGGAQGTVNLSLWWADTSATGGGQMQLRLYGATGTTELTSSSANNSPGRNRPLTLGYQTTGAVQSNVWRAEPTKNYNRTPTGYPTTYDPSPGWVQSVSPMQPVGDGSNLVQGVAPGAGLVGVKVLDDVGVGLSSAALNGLYWVRDNAATYHIVVANLSLEGTASYTVDTAVNNLVRTSGVVVVCAAGNQRQAGAGFASPASAAAALTVVATNENDQITNYSSYGSPGETKPDIAAPGGSDVTHRWIVSVDSNGGDSRPPEAVASGWVRVPGTDPPYPDAFPSDYTAMRGTSFAAAHVAGAAALVAASLGTWNYTGAQARRVKALLEMTATETIVAAESAPNPTLERGAKDISEGYGRLNVDAAVEAASVSCPTNGSAQSAALGNAVTDRKCWGRYFDVTAGSVYTTTLTNPTGADYDLYVYTETSTDNVAGGTVGDPVLQGSSTTAATGGSEHVTFVAPAAGRYYIVVKRVSGSGTFQVTCVVSTLGVTVAPTTPWALGGVAPGAVRTTWTTSWPAGGGYFTATNSGTGPELLKISSSTSTNGWIPVQTAGTDRFVIGWGQTATIHVEPAYRWFDGGSNARWLSLIESPPAPLVAGGTFKFDLQFRAPTASAVTTQQSFVVTVAAYPPS